MPTLYIKCPTTGKPVPTGINVPKNFDRSGLSQNSTQCPHCKKMHTWNGHDAFFLDDK
jgi:endogenous inhibitor of DNA gyrase (YacG/DUF329 family)